MTAETIDDAMGSVWKKAVKICAATAATATDNIAAAYREIADCFDSHGRGLDFGIVFPRPAHVLNPNHAAENIGRPASESRAQVGIIRRQAFLAARANEISVSTGNRQFHCAAIPGSESKPFSTAEAAALRDEPACHRICQPIGPIKSNFNFLGGNLHNAGRPSA
jgi:hypothetical protein